jgi:hypothetical protein
MAETLNTHENGNCANCVLAAGVFYIDGEKMIFQRASYIEDGWYVEMTDDNIVLWEIPYGGGEPMRVSSYHDLISAIKSGMELS